MKKIICLTIGLFLVYLKASSQPGTLDESFGTGGKIINETFTGECKAIAIQADGKIITGGVLDAYNELKTGIIINRFNADGSLDYGFGEEGKVIMYEAEDQTAFTVYAIAVQDDAKIIICALFLQGEGKGNVGVVRLNSDGKLDNSFSENGVAIINVGKNDRIGDMALQPDGKILVAGRKGINEIETGDVFVLRLKTNGELDEGFGENGITLVSKALINLPKLTAIALQTDGKILIGGESFSNSYVIIRLLTNGAIDNTFGEDKDGVASLKFEEIDIRYASLYDITTIENGKILAAGTAGDNSGIMALARFNSDGSVDSSFGNKKGYTTLLMETGAGGATDVYVQSDHSIILIGNYSTTNSNMAAVKFSENGIVDSSFGENGIALANFANVSTRLTTSQGAYQNDGKIVIGGFIFLTDDADFANIALVRFNNDAILPITYTKFTATQTKEYIALNWQTATELNNKYFAVERSSNAVNYSSIAQVNSTVTGTAVKDYFYTDKLPVAGTNYYRLKQTDADGKYSYSKVVSIGFLKPGTIQLFPNPAKDQLTVKGLNAANISTISLLDIQGKLIQQFTAKQLAAYTFNISNLSSGTYMVRVKDNNGVATQKFVKQ